jgi:hypothetical protein
MGKQVTFEADPPGADPADDEDLVFNDATAEQIAAVRQIFGHDGIAGQPVVAAELSRPEPVRATRLPGAESGKLYQPPEHPLTFTGQALSALQGALEQHERGRWVAADPDAQFATLTTSTLGAGRVWGSNMLRGPRLLHVIAGVPRQPASAIYAQFPQLTLPTASAAVGEGVTLVEYASSTAGSVTAGRFGRWTDLSTESLIGADAGSLTGMHRLGIALDLDNVLIGLVNTAAGAAVAFTADVPAAIRKAMALVQANTASGDPADLVILAHPDNVALLESVTPIGGQTIGERFQKFSGALVYPSNAVPTGFMLVANLALGARYFEAVALQTVTDTAIKTGVQTVATFLIGGYGVTLTAGFVSKVDVVTP